MADSAEDRVVVAYPREVGIGLHNRASVMRGWNANNGVAKNVPRFKFSFFANIKLGETVSVGSFVEDMPSGALMNSIKSIDMPTVSYEVEELPQYNRVKQIIKKQVRKDVTVTLYDDSTSYIRGLLAAYRAHYTFAPLVNRISGVDAISYPKTEFGTPHLPNDESSVPSAGMRSVQEPFFTLITLFDLGSEPSSANIYHMIKPTIKDVTSSGFDYGDNDSPREITVVFAYEELVEHIGVNWSETSIHADFPDVYSQGVRISREAIAGTSQSPRPRDGFQPSATAIQDDLMNAMRQSMADQTTLAALQRANVDPGELLIAVQKSIKGGVLNFEDLQKNVFNALPRSTAIQNIRIAVRKALLIRQAIEQGRFLDVVPLLGAGWDQIRDFSWETAGGTIDSVVSTMRGTIPGAGSWVQSHINGLQLPKLGGIFGG